MGRVQQDALAAAERFRLAEGKILPALTAALQAESAATAYAAGQVLAALARGAARQMAIVQALAAAVRDPANRRPVYVLAGREIRYLGQLDELLYSLLVQVAGAGGGQRKQRTNSSPHLNIELPAAPVDEAFPGALLRVSPSCANIT